MSGERVDLDELLELARAAQRSARERGEATEPFGNVAHAWAMSPRRDGAVDVVVESSGADVFDRALEVDTKFAVAAQPAVVQALVARILELEAVADEALIYWSDAVPLDSGRIGQLRESLQRGVVLP